MNVYFENITLTTDTSVSKTNIHIIDGIIVHNSPEDSPKKDEKTLIINGSSFHCLPGLFDMHVHFREPGQEYKETIETGCLSASNGGFTGVLCMPNTSPAIDHPAIVKYINAKAKGNIVDVYSSAAMTLKREGTTLSPMRQLHDAGVLMFTDDGSCLMDSQLMRNAYDYASDFDGLLSQHCEDHQLTKNFAMNEGSVSEKLGLKGYPTVAEEIIIARDIQLANYCGNRRYHVSHMSTKGGVELVRDAKARGQRITCEVTPHHFVLTDEAIEKYGTNAKMNPPLRTEEHRLALIDGICNGTVDCIATDHAPHASHEKVVDFSSGANGITGLETSFSLSYTTFVASGLLTLNRLVTLMSTNPRSILGLPPISFEVGSKANMTIVDTNQQWNIDIEKHQSKSLNTPFNGYTVIGKPLYTINNSQMYTCNL